MGSASIPVGMRRPSLQRTAKYTIASGNFEVDPSGLAVIHIPNKLPEPPLDRVRLRSHGSSPSRLLISNAFLMSHARLSRRCTLGHPRARSRTWSQVNNNHVTVHFQLDILFNLILQPNDTRHCEPLNIPPHHHSGSSLCGQSYFGISKRSLTSLYDQRISWGTISLPQSATNE